MAILNVIEFLDPTGQQIVHRVPEGGSGDRCAERPNPAPPHPAERHGAADRAVCPVVFVRSAGRIFSELSGRWEIPGGNLRGCC